MRSSKIHDFLTIQSPLEASFCRLMELIMTEDVMIVNIVNCCSSYCRFSDEGKCVLRHSQD